MVGEREGNSPEPERIGGDCMKAKPRMYRGMKVGTEEWEVSLSPEMEGIDPSTLGQSTGESDRTGAQLWEDDVVTDHYGSRFVIVWYRAAFRAKNMDTKCMWALDAARVEKVGTIYDAAEKLYAGAPRRSSQGGHDDEE